MARNYEKNFGRLNRLWLEKETGKKQCRPKLSALKTAAEISQWLPELKKEIDFFLKQMEVPCYTEKKILECKKHIACLEGEYKAYIRKLRRLDSSISVTPWTPRPYERKTERGDILPTLHPTECVNQHAVIDSLQTPVLKHDKLYMAFEGESYRDNLTLGSKDSAPYDSSQNKPLSSTLCTPSGKDTVPDKGISEETCEQEKSFGKNTEIPLCCQKNEEKNVLGLSYSSSEEDS